MYFAGNGIETSSRGIEGGKVEYREGRGGSEGRKGTIKAEQKSGGRRFPPTRSPELAKFTIGIKRRAHSKKPITHRSSPSLSGGAASDFRNSVQNPSDGPSGEFPSFGFGHVAGHFCLCGKKISAEFLWVHVIFSEAKEVSSLIATTH